MLRSISINILGNPCSQSWRKTPHLHSMFKRKNKTAFNIYDSDGDEHFVYVHCLCAAGKDLVSESPIQNEEGGDERRWQQLHGPQVVVVGGESGASPLCRRLGARTWRSSLRFSITLWRHRDVTRRVDQSRGVYVVDIQWRHPAAWQSSVIGNTRDRPLSALTTEYLGLYRPKCIFYHMYVTQLLYSYVCVKRFCSLVHFR